MRKQRDCLRKKPQKVLLIVNKTQKKILKDQKKQEKD